MSTSAERRSAGQRDTPESGTAQAHTRFYDSAGLQVLVRGHNRAQAEGGELRLVIPADGAVRRIVTLTGMDRSIPCFASLTEALAQTSADPNP